MSYSESAFLGLKKAVVGSSQPFETVVFNDNWDAVDSGVSGVSDRLDVVEPAVTALDGRLDVVEANDWVTSARIAADAVGSSEIASGAVGASELASVLDLSGKTVSVAAPSADAHASTKKYVDDSIATGGIAAWTSYTPTLGGGFASSFTVTSASYGRAGKTVFVRCLLTASTVPSGSGLTATLPVAIAGGGLSFTGFAKGYPLFHSVTTSGGVSTVTFKVLATNGAYGTATGFGTSVPGSWLDSDTVEFFAVYQGV
jgi:hypothetical protein